MWTCVLHLKDGTRFEVCSPLLLDRMDMRVYGEALSFVLSETNDLEGIADYVPAAEWE